MADGNAPTIEQRQECKIRMLERRVRGQAEELRKLHAILAERKVQLNLLGIAWSTRGSDARAAELTDEEVRRLVQMVDRIQRRHFNVQYRLMYDSLDEQVRTRIESTRNAWMESHSNHYAALRRAARWKKLAKKLRRASLDRRPASEDR